MKIAALGSRPMGLADFIMTLGFGAASARELIASIESYLKDRDLSPKRYLWKAGGQAILEKIQRARAAVQKENIV